MAEVRPFRALRYASHSGSYLRNVIAPPYDVISRAMCEKLRTRHPHNVIRIILGDPSTCSESELSDPTRYKNARKILNQWKLEKILAHEERPSLYVLEDRFEWNGETRSRTGILATVKLEEFGRGNILPHEKTLASPIQDRYTLMTETQIQESPIYMTVDDSSKELRTLFERVRDSAPSEFDNVDESIHHRIFTMSDPRWIETVKNVLKSKPFLIADGHHRYQTALRFKEQNASRLPAADYILALIAPTPDPGVVLTSIQRFFETDLSTENVLKMISDSFEVEEKPVSWDAFEKSGAPIALLGASSMHLLRPKKKDIQVPSAILNEKVVKPILKIHLDKPEDQKRVTYVKNRDELFKLSKKGIGFWVAPMTAAQVMEEAQKGHVLPQKSTFFYPKVMSGFVFHDLTIT
jgi:uncharacterized protein (DUF1015 family)